MQSNARSLNAQTYIPATTMADLVRVFQESGLPHKSSYSHVLYHILLATHKQWECEHFDSTESALEYLDSQGFSVAQLKTKGRGDKLLRAMNQEARQAENIQDLARPIPTRSDEIGEMLKKEE